MSSPSLVCSRTILASSARLESSVDVNGGAAGIVVSLMSIGALEHMYQEGDTPHAYPLCKATPPPRRSTMALSGHIRSLRMAAGLPIGARTPYQVRGRSTPGAGDGFRLKAGMTLLGACRLFSLATWL